MKLKAQCAAALLVIIFLGIILICGISIANEPVVDQKQLDESTTEVLTTSPTEPGQPSDDPSQMYVELDKTYMASDSLEKREKALDELRVLVKKHPGDYELLWRAARMAWFVGDWLDDDELEKLVTLGLEGQSYIDEALSSKPESIEGHYYKALTLSTYGRGISIIKALIKGLGKDYEKNLAWVLAKDDTFDHGGALRALGRFFWKLPWPKHDYKKSLDYLDRALKVDPKVLRTHFYRGDTLWSLKRYEEARKAFEYAINTDPNDFDKKDAPWIKSKAKERLAKLMKKHF